MLGIVSKKPTEDDLAAVAIDAATLLLDATAAAPVKPNFYAQVAARMIDADTARFKSKYHSTLTSVFVGRKILSSQSSNAREQSSKEDACSGGSVRGIRDSRHTEMHKVVLAAKDFRLAQRGPLTINAPFDSFEPLTVGMAELHSPEVHQETVEAASRKFLESLVAHGRVEMPGKSTKKYMAAAGAKRKLHTHRLVKAGKGFRLERQQRLLCGCASTGAYEEID